MNSIANDGNLLRTESLETKEETKSSQDKGKNEKSSAFEIVALAHKVGSCIPCQGSLPVDVNAIINEVGNSLDWEYEPLADRDKLVVIKKLVPGKTLERIQKLISKQLINKKNLGIKDKLNEVNRIISKAEESNKQKLETIKDLADINGLVDIYKLIDNEVDYIKTLEKNKELAYRKKILRVLKVIVEETNELNIDENISNEDNDSEVIKKGLITVKGDSGNLYYWDSRDAKASFKAMLIHNDMSESRALAFYMIDKHLKHFLPPSVKNELDIDVRQSEEFLKKNSKKITINSPSPWINPEDNWQDKISFHPSGYPLKPKSIDEEILNTIYQAIQESKPIEFEYKSIHKSINMDEKYTVSPQQLKYQNHQLLLLGVINGKKNEGKNILKYFEVARITNLSEANKKEYFIYEDTKDSHTKHLFKALVHEWVINYFANVTLGKNQKFTHHKKETYYFEAEIFLPKHFKHDGPDTFFFANMLGMFADAMEVLEPPCLRKEMERRAKQHHSLYLTNDDSVEVITRSPHETSEKLTK